MQGNSLQCVDNGSNSRQCQAPQIHTSMKQWQPMWPWSSLGNAQVCTLVVEGDKAQ